MYELNSILKRSKFENFMAYLISEIGDNEEVLDNYDILIDQSYDIFFDGLEEMYPDASRDDDKLFDIVCNFISTHDDIFFEAGTLVGFQLYKGFESKYQNHKSSDIPSLLKNKISSKIQQRKDIDVEKMLDDIRGHRLENALEDTIRNDKSYQKLEVKTSQKIMKVDKIELNHEQWQVVDSALSACNEKSAYYGEMAYKQGFKDAIKLYTELFE